MSFLEQQGAGRRRVAHLTNHEWRAALQQQIQDKQRRQAAQQAASRGLDPRTQQDESAAPPQPEDELETAPSLGLQRAATTSTGGAAGRRRSRPPAPLPREEYLRSLQQQMADKQRLEEAARDKEQARRGRRRTSEDNCALHQDERRLETESHGEEQAATRLESDVPEPASSSRSNQHEGESTRPTAAQAASEPAALSTIVGFCEELKRQNEDVKQQLQQQHSVLARLAAEAHDTAAAGGRRRQDGSNKSALQPRGRPRRGDSGAAAAAGRAGPRPRPSRGVSKIPLPRRTSSSSFRAAGAQIVSQSSVEELQSGERPHAAVVASTRGCTASADVHPPRHEATKPSQLEHVAEAPGERPLAGDSAFVRHWTAQRELELPNCTSDALLGGSSALVPLAQSLAGVFRR